MSLGQLLAAGRSLVGGKDGPGRYRVNKQIALPKFISPRNPFTASPESTEASPVAPEPVVPAPDGLGARIKSRLTAAGARQRAKGRSVARWLQKWMQGLNPFSRLTRWPSLCDPRLCARPEPTKNPLQPELSLEAVRVVRNDLSDADFEVVPAKSAVADASGRAAVQPEMLAPAGNTWNRLTTKVFGVGQT